MKQRDGMIRIGVTVFKVLAWISLVLQVGIGLTLLVMGGDPVPVGGVDIPARVVGVLNGLAGLLYFFFLFLAAHVLSLLLDIRDRLERTGASVS